MIRFAILGLLCATSVFANDTPTDTHHPETHNVYVLDRLIACQLLAQVNGSAADPNGIAICSKIVKDVLEGDKND